LLAAESAATAGMSERSFQRHLAEAGLRFSRLVEEARFDVARSLLANRTLRVIDVSTELGYRDSANFTRAFRRWSGISPQLFRRVIAALGRERFAAPPAAPRAGSDAAEPPLALPQASPEPARLGA
jgi:AraC-like DNA-binding protein